MKLAEELYQAGFVSYPRTETDMFDPGYDLRAMVRTQADSGAPWAAFAQRLDTTPLFRWPRPGEGSEGEGREESASDSPALRAGPALPSVMDVVTYAAPGSSLAAGGHDDKAHPPIHPTKAFAGDGNSEKMRLYEFIARHFLACALPAAAAACLSSCGGGGRAFLPGLKP